MALRSPGKKIYSGSWNPKVMVLSVSAAFQAAFHHGQFLSGINFPVTSLNKSGDVPPCVTGTRRREASSSGDDVRVLSVLQTDGRLSVS